MPFKGPARRREWAKQYRKNDSYRLRNPTHWKKWRERARKRNREIVDEHLRTHPCVDCSESDIVVLDFDHMRGVKKEHVCDMVHQARVEATLRAEIAKCDICCANCHRRKTAKQLKYRHRI